MGWGGIVCRDELDFLGLKNCVGIASEESFQCSEELVAFAGD